MSLLICVSGPQGQTKKAAKALKDAGYRILLTDTGDLDQRNWGHEPNHETMWTGERVDPNDPNSDIIPGTGEIVAKPTSKPIQFLTVEGDDGDAGDLASSVLEPFGWRFRSSRPRRVQPPAPTLDERLAMIGLTRADIAQIAKEG